MRKNSLLLFMVLVIVTTILAGCGSSEGDKFVGRWIGDSIAWSNQKVYLDISTKDGKTFAVNFVQPDGTSVSGLENVATLKDTYLELNGMERLAMAPDGTFNFRSGIHFTKLKQ